MRRALLPSAAAALVLAGSASAERAPRLAVAHPGAGVFAGGKRLLSHGYAPAFSRDGTKLAFVSRIGGNAELYVASSDGTKVRRLTYSPGAEDGPAWAPDGRRIVVERGGELFVVRLDLVGERRLAAGRDPAWSPDGTRVAFVRDDDVWTVRADGRGARRLTGEGSVESAPAWSPRGTRLVYVSDLAGNRELHTIGPDGRGAVRLTNDERDDSQPAWSPDGRRIAFVREGEVWTMNGDGTAARRAAGRGASPAWHPPVARRVELLPDLDQRAPHLLTISRIRGRWALGFASAVDNVGAGPYWIRGSRPTRATPTMRGVQRIALAGGGWREERPIGFWRYVASDSHEHWHFLPFERYELRDATGRMLVRDHKSGFCLGDRFPHARVARRVRPRFPAGRCESGNPAATSVQAGTSVGYTDRYFPHYHGQNIALSGIPAGVYTFVHRVNPELLFRESDYTNNAASVRIRLTWRGGAPQVTTLRVCESSPRC